MYPDSLGSWSSWLNQLTLGLYLWFFFLTCFVSPSTMSRHLNQPLFLIYHITRVAFVFSFDCAHWLLHLCIYEYIRARVKSRNSVCWIWGLCCRRKSPAQVLWFNGDLQEEMNLLMQDAAKPYGPWVIETQAGMRSNETRALHFSCHLFTILFQQTIT